MCLRQAIAKSDAPPTVQARQRQSVKVSLPE